MNEREGVEVRHFEKLPWEEQSQEWGARGDLVPFLKLPLRFWGGVFN